MRSNSKQPLPRLYVGEEVGDPGELKLIHRLRSDLAAADVQATLFANFFPPARNSCQVDLLVRAPTRTILIEIKNLRKSYPVVGPLNGPWSQIIADGSSRSLGKNAGRQALDCTFAVSDAMRALAESRSGKTSDFKRQIDTTVTIWREIPEGSTFDPPSFVSIVGYDQLLERIQEPGRSVDWEDEEWAAFIRELNLFQPDNAESNDQEQIRVVDEAIADYRALALVGRTEPDEGRVDLAIATTDGDLLPFDSVSPMVRGGNTIAVVGPSGSGKTNLASHVALHHCLAGRLVVWLRAAEYEPDRFSNLVARSMAPYSAEQWQVLVRRATDTGMDISLVLDGLNECPIELRQQLLQQLQAFTLRYPAGVLLTSTEDTGLAVLPGAQILNTVAPDDSDRLAILAVHGCTRPGLVSQQFQTPYELSIAAQCEDELDQSATTADLLASFISRLVPTEQQRTGLRAIAKGMNDQLRSSLRILEVNNRLHDPTIGLTPAEINEVRQNRLLFEQHQRVQFRHDLIANFLAAENLVLSTANSDALGELLALPGNSALRSEALAIASEPTVVWPALQHLEDSNLLVSAVLGQFGHDSARFVVKQIEDVLRIAIETTNRDQLAFRLAHAGGEWSSSPPLTTFQQAMLSSVGRLLRSGYFLDEVRELLEQTDDLCRSYADELSENGASDPATTLIQSAYSQVRPADGNAPAASYVLCAFELESMFSPLEERDSTTDLVHRMSNSTHDRSWGCLYLSVLATRHSRSLDLAGIPSILRRSLDAGGYLLQLQALWAAQRHAGSEKCIRDEIIDVIHEFETDNIFLQSTVLEVLSSFGEVHTTVTIEDLQTHIREVLAHPDDDSSLQAAVGIVTSQFEDEALVGPYYDAVASLTLHERVELLTMAALGSPDEGYFFLDWTLHQLADLTPTGSISLDACAQQAFRRFLSGPPSTAVLPAEMASACLAAIRGWSTYHDSIPALDEPVSSDSRVWGLVAELLLAEFRSDANVDIGIVWEQLNADARGTIGTLMKLERASHTGFGRSRGTALSRLSQSHGSAICRLIEKALAEPSTLAPFEGRPWDNPIEFAIGCLRQMGDVQSVDVLRSYAVEPETADQATSAIRDIHARIDE